MTKRYDPENFLIRSDGMTDEQYEVLRKWLGENFQKHRDCSDDYGDRCAVNIERLLWTYRGVSRGYQCYSDIISGWCDISKNKPPVITYEEFEKYILSNEKGADTMTVDFPDFDFKISCGDRPEIRQWLKDNGVSKWKNGVNVFEAIEGFPYLLITNKSLSWRDEKGYSYCNLPELTPTFGVTGWTVEQKYSKEKLVLQESISKMEQELEQMKQRVQEIK